LIATWKISGKKEIKSSGIQGVPPDLTASEKCQKGRWPVQELIKHIKKIEDF
jgi:hypothetical protein